MPMVAQPMVNARLAELVDWDCVCVDPEGEVADPEGAGTESDGIVTPEPAQSWFSTRMMRVSY